MGLESYLCLCIRVKSKSNLLVRHKSKIFGMVFAFKILLKELFPYFLLNVFRGIVLKNVYNILTLDWILVVKNYELVSCMGIYKPYRTEIENKLLAFVTLKPR